MYTFPDSSLWNDVRGRCIPRHKSIDARAVQKWKQSPTFNESRIQIVDVG
jgi:hypothetical protein